MTKHIPTCPICDASDWRTQTHEVKHQYRGRELTVPNIEYSVCGNCGFDLVLPLQQRTNDARIMDARRLEEGLLSSREIREIRKSLELTQSRASEILGGGPNAFSKYERGEVMQSRAIDRILRFLARCPEALSELSGVSKGPLVRSNRAVATHYVRSEDFSEPEPRYVKVRLGPRKHFDVVDDDQYLDDAA